jgi:hypothetical protein
MDTTFLPCTRALRRHLSAITNERAIRDLLYLEAWEINPQPGAGSALRINQLRRANPELAAEIRAELIQIGRAVRALPFRLRPPVPDPAPPGATLTS